MTSLSGPVLSLIELKGYRYSQICRTNIAIASTVLVYPAQFPQRIAIYIWMFPKSGWRISSPNKRTKCKAIKANNNHANGDLSPKVTPLLNQSPTESPVLWYGGRTDLGFCVCVCKCFGLARVATDFLFYPKERLKSTAKTFVIFSWVRGVDYRKGRY